MSILPQEFLDGLGCAIALKQDGRLLVVAGKEVDGGVTTHVDVLRRVVQSGVHLGDDELGGAVGQQLLHAREGVSKAMRGGGYRAAPTCAIFKYTGSSFLQWPHHGA